MSNLSKLLILITTCISSHHQHKAGGVAHAEHAENPNTCIYEQECSASYKRLEMPKASKHCPSSLDLLTTELSTCLLQRSYDAGRSAQAYKPNAPMKKQVCDVRSNRTNKVARNLLWRTNKREATPIFIRGNIYTCAEEASRTNNITMEVWQPRPDGTYSSLRQGVEEGDCRATVSVDAIDTESKYPNLLKSFDLETLAPGSHGLLGGLVPSTFGEFVYGQGKIHFLINVDGHYPLFDELSMSDLNRFLLKDDSATWNSVHFFGPDLRPHVAISSRDKDVVGGMEVQSATIIDSKLQVEIDFFLAPMSNEATDSMQARRVFCSDRGWMGSISSFFKEPIAVCFPSLLDYFAL